MIGHLSAMKVRRDNEEATMKINITRIFRISIA